jgi:hypothetical protein
MRRSQTVTVEQMRAEYKSFAKTSEYCEWEETLLLSALYLVRAPCSHQFSLGEDSEWRSGFKWISPRWITKEICDPEYQAFFTYESQRKTRGVHDSQFYNLGHNCSWHSNFGSDVSLIEITSLRKIMGKFGQFLHFCRRPILELFDTIGFLRTHRKVLDRTILFPRSFNVESAVFASILPKVSNSIRYLSISRHRNFPQIVRSIQFCWSFPRIRRTEFYGIPRSHPLERCSNSITPTTTQQWRLRI